MIASLSTPDDDEAESNKLISTQAQAEKARPGVHRVKGAVGVYLKKGELDKAIADYDAALGIEPMLAVSLYGRGIAKRQKGDAAGSETDITAALALRPNIADELAIFGIK